MALRFHYNFRERDDESYASFKWYHTDDLCEVLLS